MTEPQSEHTDVNSLQVFEACDGWDTLGPGYLLIKTRLTIGERTPGRRMDAAWTMTTLAQAVALEAPSVELTTKRVRQSFAITNRHNWRELIPLDDLLGVAPELVALVEESLPGGDWVEITYPGLKIHGRASGRRSQYALGWVVDDELQALVAPCVREDSSSPSGQEDSHG